MITLQSLDLQKMTPEELGELLIDAKKAYYTTSKPIMDDHTYDTLEEILKQKAPYHRIFKKVGNPNFDTGFNKKRHSITMGSQNKVNKIDDLIHYFELKKVLPLLVKGGDRGGFVTQPKCDGISLEIIYKNGELVESITRGDGIIGDVITQNVVKMKNFVANPSKNFTGSVRCEIIMTYKDFEKLNSIVGTHHDAFLPDDLSSTIDNLKYSNPRNAVSGISQRLDSKFSELCTLLAVDIAPVETPDLASLQNKTASLPIKTELEKIETLKKLGFKTVDTHHCPDFQSIEKIYQKFLINERKLFTFDIDGLVIKINDLKLQKDLGSHNNRPKGQVAYKFPAQSNETRIVSIDWQIGPMGAITPVAKVDPVELSGAIITFASLANYDLIKKKNFNINDIVQLSRRGDVIPHIEKVISKVTPGHAKPPTNCPSCNTKLIVDSKFIHCPNTKKCPAQIQGSLKLFCDTLEIKGISDKTIEKLYNVDLIKLPGDFYKLKVSDFENLAGLGEKSGSNIVHQIQNKKTLTLKQVLDASIIPTFSSARIQQIITAGFNTPKKILNITVADLEALPGIKITLAKKIYDGIQSRKDFIQSILQNVGTHYNAFLPKNGPLQNLNFAITGSLSVPRKSLEDKIESLGGKVVSTVTSNTSYLITNETSSNSSKFKSAKKLGVKMITEEEFNKL